MNAAADQPGSADPLVPADTFVPAFPRGLLRNLVVDMALPWTAIQVLPRLLDVSATTAFALAALFPAASLFVHWRRRRRVDAIGLTVLVVLTGAVSLALITHDIRYALLKPALGAALFGLANLGSLATHTPLMFFFARQLTAGDDPAKHAAWTERLVGSAAFRRAMRLLTIVWGLAFLAKAALWAAAALALPAGAAILTGPVLTIGLFAALMIWTIAFARRGAARIAAAA